MNSVFDSYQPFKGEISRRHTGSLVSFETGEAVGYGIFKIQDRGTMFITPGTAVYEGMIVGYSPKSEDINVNVCKKKQLTNTRGFRQRRGPPPHAAAADEPGGMSGISGGRRTAGGHPGESASGASGF